MAHFEAIELENGATSLPLGILIDHFLGPGFAMASLIYGHLYHEIWCGIEECGEGNTFCKALSMWFPHPLQVGFPQLLQVVSWHIAEMSGTGSLVRNEKE